MASSGLRMAVTRGSHLEAIYSAAIAAVSPVKLLSESLQYDTVTKVLTVSNVSYQLNRYLHKNSIKTLVMRGICSYVAMFSRLSVCTCVIVHCTGM